MAIIYCKHGRDEENCLKCCETWCRHGAQREECAQCVANDSFCKHGVEKSRCADCDSRGAFDSGERDAFETCEHGVKWADECLKCDGTDGTSPEPLITSHTDKDQCAHGIAWTKPCKECSVSDKAGPEWWRSHLSCDHTPALPVTTINGCKIYACRSGWASDWKAVPPYHMLIDCLSHGAPVLDLPPKLKFLQRYASANDEYTIGIPWADYKTPPVQFEFWRALAKKLPVNGVCIVTCVGAHGRTGTAIAALLLGANPGMSDLEATRIVRAGHCEKAIESLSQREYLKDMALKFAPKRRRKEILKEHAGQAAKVPTEDLVTHTVAPCIKGPSHTGICKYSDINDLTT